MSDETCGHPTADGTPCQNPASEGDSCWIDAHGGSTSVGRDFTITEADHDAILDAARDGMSKSGCARAAGVAKSQLDRYLDAHDDFRSAFTRARHEGERKLVKGPLIDRPDDPVEMDGQHARFLLSTSFDYVKTEKREHEDVTEGEGGFGTNVIVSGEYDPDDGDV
jgi:hypothetical protein